jgi:hypothetical protein
VQFAQRAAHGVCLSLCGQLPESGQKQVAAIEQSPKTWHR